MNNRGGYNAAYLPGYRFMVVAMLVSSEKIEWRLIKMKRFNKFVPAHTEKIELYDFLELSEKSKDNVRDYKYHDIVARCNDFYFDEMMGTIKTVADLYGFTYDCESTYDDFKYIFYLKSNGGESDYCDIVGARAYAWLENNVFDGLRVNPKLVKSENGYRKENGYDGFKECPFTGVYHDDNIYTARKIFIDKLREDRTISVKDFFEIFMDLVAKDLEDEMEAMDSDDYMMDWEALNEIEGYESDGTIWTKYDIEKAGYTA